MTADTIDDKTYDLLIKCEMQLDEVADLIKEFVSKKHPNKEITEIPEIPEITEIPESALDLLKERRAAMRLAKKVREFLRTYEANSWEVVA